VKPSLRSRTSPKFGRVKKFYENKKMQFLKELFQNLFQNRSAGFRKKVFRKSLAPFAPSLSAPTSTKSGEPTPDQLAEALNWLSRH
jgi:hypothetical protein